MIGWMLAFLRCIVGLEARFEGFPRRSEMDLKNEGSEPRPCKYIYIYICVCVC